MLYLIADIKTEVPAAGGMASRCGSYRIEGNDSEAEIIIDASLYNYDYWKQYNATREEAAYMESGFQFYKKLLDFDGLMLHASATVIDGEAYLFAGQSGIGKSTHASLLKQLRPEALLINDDKPAIRLVDGRWMCYGTPWSGKNGININAGYPLKAITLLTTRRDRNNIKKAEPLTALSGLIACSAGRGNKETMIKLAALIDRLMKDIPVYEMDSLADEEAAVMALKAMRGAESSEEFEVRSSQFGVRGA